MKAFKLAGALAGLAFGVCGSAAQAAVLFSDLGPGQSYSSNAWSVVSSAHDTPAFSFVAASSGSVSEIDVALISLIEFDHGSDSCRRQPLDSRPGVRP